MKAFSILALILILLACKQSDHKEESAGTIEPIATTTPADSTTITPSSDSAPIKEPGYDANKINPSAEVITITLKTAGETIDEMKFDQTEIHVKEGSTVKLVLENDAKDPSMIHNFVLIRNGSADKVAQAGEKAGVDKDYVEQTNNVLVSTKLARPGKTIEITFPAPPKGTYEFISTYPGHSQRMRGKFIVD